MRQYRRFAPILEAPPRVIARACVRLPRSSPDEIDAYVDDGRLKHSDPRLPASSKIAYPGAVTNHPELVLGPEHQA